MTPRPAALLRTLAGLPARAGMLLVRAYQRFVSPALPPSCRYHPSCSEYAYLAIGEWGLVRGSLLAAWRILRCNPWSPGGFDMPPRRRSRGSDRRVAHCGPAAAGPYANTPRDPRGDTDPSAAHCGPAAAGPYRMRGSWFPVGAAGRPPAVAPRTRRRDPAKEGTW